MLSIMQKQIDLSRSTLLLEDAFCDDTSMANWEDPTSNWSISNGWATGVHRENSGGMLYSKQHFPGDIVMDFEGRTIPPCDNDLNFVFCSAGWDFAHDDAGIGYIAGLQGWWDGKCGMERYPRCEVWAHTSLLHFEPGTIYHIQAGVIQGTVFIFVDGRLVIEMQDPSPIDSSRYGKVGFGTYASQVQIRHFKLYRPYWEPVDKSYAPVF